MKVFPSDAKLLNAALAASHQLLMTFLHTVEKNRLAMGHEVAEEKKKQIEKAIFAIELYDGLPALLVVFTIDNLTGHDGAAWMVSEAKELLMADYYKAFEPFLAKVEEDHRLIPIATAYHIINHFKIKIDETYLPNTDDLLAGAD